MKRKLVNFDYFQKITEKSLSNSLKELVEARDHLAEILDVNELSINSFDESTVIFEASNGNFYRAEYEVTPSEVKFLDVEELVIDEESENKQAKNILSSMLEAILDDNQAEANKFFEEYMELESGRRKRNKELYGENVVESVLNEGRGVSSGNRAYYTRNGKRLAKPHFTKRKGATPDPERSRRTKLQWNRIGSRMRLAMLRKRGKRQSYAANKRALGGHSKNFLRATSGGTTHVGRKNRNSGKVLHRLAGRTKRSMNEWLTLSNNVFDYVDFKETGVILTENVEQLENGTLNVTIPTIKSKNEMKIQMMNYDVLKTDVKVLREASRFLHTDGNFCQMVSNIKRYNNISDDKELQEAIDKLVVKYPSVMYLTQEELANSISLAFENTGVTNYDDNICRFISEGILRVAHNAYPEKVEKIAKLANVDLNKFEDKYKGFQNACSNYFPKLDESTNLEFGMFEDLLNAVMEVRQIALEEENEEIKIEAADFITELQSIVNGKQVPSLELAVDVAEWLGDIVETNLEMSDWEVEKTPYRTVSGDHPQMAKNARKSYTPANDFSGDWGDPAPAIDGEKKGYKNGAAEEMRSRSWGNKGGKDTYPTLDNPYVPEPFGDYTMKGEKGADKDNDGLGVWSDENTFPNLKNPYIPSAMIPKQKVDPNNSVE